MSLWTGTTINTNRTANAFNRVWNRKAEPIVRKKNAFLYGLLGKDETSKNPTPIPVAKTEVVSGDKFEVRLLGKLDSFQTLSDGNAEVASVAGSYTADYFGSAVFDLTHYNHHHQIPYSEIANIAGDEAKTASYMDEVMDMLMYSQEDTLGTAINGTGNQTRETLGSWRYAVDDSTTHDTYGTITRSTAANVDFRGNAGTSSNPLTLTNILDLQLTINQHGGEATLGLAGNTVYRLVKVLIEAKFGEYVQRDKWMKYGGPYCGYNNTVFVHDHRAPNQTLGMFTPQSWIWVKRDILPFRVVQVDASKKAATSIIYDGWNALICKCPSHNGYIPSILS